ncbi:putative plant ubiquilin [Hibiscus syriacus]|uniref:Plant ubiquilin n=1 Tax=Hibiscus syriacus TaxID=106335 RepID=A0A6A3AC12_HIBSY|nr:putative plant ubiquilin [Hibiscus syriacus]
MSMFMRAKKSFSTSLKSLTRFQRCNHTTLGERSLQAELYSKMAPAANPTLPSIDTSKWKKIQASKVGISSSMISHPPWIVLDTLHKGGFEAYLVGGCVRDLLLNRIPKDFDVITTANLEQIRKKFRRAVIVGRRFPICMVHVKGSIVEVSSFETVAKHNKGKEKSLPSLIPKRCDKKDLIRWRNSRVRDFTINSLFFDPFTCNIYDYNDGMSDLKLLKLRTLIPAHVSFQEDCARILRGLRIASRLHLSISEDTERAMHDLSASIEGLDKGRLVMEMNYMLSYGAAVPSICLLGRFNLLNILLPFQAAYINLQRSAKNSMMLMKLFFNLDKLVSCDHPADSSLWVGLLMFHLALVNNPQDALVVWTFASVLYHGNWKSGVEFARELGISEVKFVPEISGFSESKSDEDLAKEVAQFASLVQDSVWTLTKTSNLLESMSRYPFSPCSGLVFIPKSTAKNTAKLFDRIVEDIRFFSKGRRRKSPEINYYLLGKGDPCETRYALGKIILETMKAGPCADAAEIITDEKDGLQPKLSGEILTNNQSPMKKDKRRAPSLSNSDGKGRMPKKQKLAETNQNPSNSYSKKNRKVVAKDELHGQEATEVKEDEQNFKFQGKLNPRKHIGEESR